MSNSGCVLALQGLVLPAVGPCMHSSRHLILDANVLFLSTLYVCMFSASYHLFLPSAVCPF